ncbi:hypothetical protein KNN05_07830, partial [Dermacoccus nishinomiyaensis]|nr:hypothetical protein [Dermacoccus nishinomiyaensis]
DADALKQARERVQDIARRLAATPDDDAVEAATTRGRLARSSAGSIHMKAHYHDLARVRLVISLHVGAMYLRSLLTGRLVDGVGPIPIPMAWRPAASSRLRRCSPPSRPVTR